MEHTTTLDDALPTESRTFPWARVRQMVRNIWRVVALAVVASLVWCGINHRTTLASWQVPASYAGDSLEILAHMQAAAEWGVLPTIRDHIARLGAPFGADWSEYPAADDMLLLVLGQLSRVIGLGTASNLALLLAHLSTAMAFYFCARYLRCRWEWAATGGLLFAFSFHNVSRGLPHLSLVLTYTVPLALLSAWLVGASSRLTLRSVEGAFCLGTAFLLGIGNPYNLFLYLQLVGWAVAAQFIRRRRPANLIVGVSAIAVAIGSFLVVNADVWLCVDDEGAAPLMARNYGGTERFSLKPIELFLPPNTHRLQPFAFLGNRYLRWSDWRGEVFSPYLGVIGAFGFLWLMAVLTRRLLRGGTKIPGAGLQAAWILGFSSVGGGNGILAFFFGLQIFRATNRYSIFVLAIGLFFLVLRSSRLTHDWPRIAVLALTSGLIVLGLYDQIPVGPTPGAQGEIAARFEGDRLLGEQLERAFPSGAMVFQLPFVEFPEGRPVHRLSDYEHFRPFLHTRTLRFTYGALKGRARSRWYREYSTLSPAELIAKLERNGFAAIYLNRAGYQDRGEGLLAAFAAAGRMEKIEGRLQEQVIVRLNPVAGFAWPMAATPTFGQGWNAPEDTARTALRWAFGPASMAYFNPYPQSMTAEVALTVRGQGPRHFSVALNHQAIAETRIGPEAEDLSPLIVELRPGINRLDFSTSEPAVRVSEERSRLRAFALRVRRFVLRPPEHEDPAAQNKTKQIPMIAVGATAAAKSLSGATPSGK